MTFYISIYMYISTHLICHIHGRKCLQWRYRGDGITILSEASRLYYIYILYITFHKIMQFDASCVINKSQAKYRTTRILSTIHNGTIELS